MLNEDEQDRSYTEGSQHVGMKRFRIGCSGWSYGHWMGEFYPRGTRPNEMLDHYASVFDTVEVDYTFYRLPSPEAVEGWKERTPEDFVFSVKMSRLATHFHKLDRPQDDIPPFIERLSVLGPRLGPVLVQLPPSLKADNDRLENFISSFPRGVRAAVEFRHPSWLNPATYRVLERQGCALCLVDSGRMDVTGPVTADFTFVRWHGRNGASYDYSDDEIREWVTRLDGLDVPEVFAYWNNDVGGHAPRNALRMSKLVESISVQNLARAR